HVHRLPVARNCWDRWNLACRLEFTGIRAWLGSHKNIQAIQLFLEREAEHGHDSAGLFQNCFSLSDLPLGSGAGVITIAHQLDEVFVSRNLVLGNREPGLISANLQVRVGCICRYGHARSGLNRLRSLWLVSCGRAAMTKSAGEVDLPTC